jgi:colicin import membrane protein
MEIKDIKPSDYSHQNLSDKDNESDNGILISLGLHFFILSLFILQNVFFDGEKIDYESAIRVDIVGLPDKIQNQAPSEPGPSESKPTPKEEPKPPEPQAAVEPETTTKLPDKKLPQESEAIKLTKEKNKPEPSDKIKKKQQDALEKIKRMSALDKIKSDVESEQRKDTLSKLSKSTHQYKGNVLNAGTELTGLNKIQHENYVSLLDKKIKENWTLPQWLANKNYKAQALIKIDENGVVVYNQIYKSSGNTSYDDIVIETINKSSPFPKPPEKFVDIVGIKGILIGFPE